MENGNKYRIVKVVYIAHREEFYIERYKWKGVKENTFPLVSIFQWERENMCFNSLEDAEEYINSKIIISENVIKYV